MITYPQILLLTILMSTLDKVFKLLQVSHFRGNLLEPQISGVVCRSEVDWTNHQTFNLHLRQAGNLLLHT